jgi:hypothetical protein
MDTKSMGRLRIRIYSRTGYKIYVADRGLALASDRNRSDIVYGEISTLAAKM